MNNIPPSSIKVLSVGKNRPLLISRHAVLMSAGYVVVSTSDEAEALALFQSGDFALAILCDSIRPEERRKLALALRQANPSKPVLAIHDGFDYIDEADLSLENFAGPQSLLAHVDLLLNKLPPSRAWSASQNTGASTNLARNRLKALPKG